MILIKNNIILNGRLESVSDYQFYYHLFFDDVWTWNYLENKHLIPLAKDLLIFYHARNMHEKLPESTDDFLNYFFKSRTFKFDDFRNLKIYEDLLSFPAIFLQKSLIKFDLDIIKRQLELSKEIVRNIESSWNVSPLKYKDVIESLQIDDQKIIDNITNEAKLYIKHKRLISIYNNILENGGLRVSYRPWRAINGRVVSELSTINKDVFKEQKFFELDFVAFEFSIAAILSQDKTMLEIAGKEDPYLYIAEKMNVSRDEAKRRIFSAMFGGYNIFKRYAYWRREMEERYSKEIVTPSGRRAQNQSFNVANVIISSVAADISAILFTSIEESSGLIHDAILIDTDKININKVNKKIKEIFEKLGLFYDSKIIKFRIRKKC